MSADCAWEFAATGTRWRIHHSGTVSDELAVKLACAVEEDEARWSRFRPDSELSALNRSGGEWFTVSGETFELLEACERFRIETNDLFQPLVGAAVIALGYARSVTDALPYSDRTPAAAPVEGVVELDTERRGVRIPAGGALDFGGIGKGWIAERLARLVRRVSDDPALLIDAGGDLLAVTGVHVVAVERHAAPGGPPQCWIRLGPAQGVATSGYGRRRWRNGDGVEVHHLIDPVTGAPGRHAHATVVADGAATADVHAKVLALRPEMALTTQYAAAVTVDGQSFQTASWSSVRTDPVSRRSYAGA